MKVKLPMIPMFIIFLILKLTNVIDWSWFWVTAPLWIPAVVLFFVMLIALVCFMCIEQKD